jgi:hypothetical protein
VPLPIPADSFSAEVSCSSIVRAIYDGQVQPQEQRRHQNSPAMVPSPTYSTQST